MPNLSANLSGYGDISAVSVTATGDIEGATINDLVIDNGTLAGSTPASVTWTRLGAFYFAVGAGAPTSVDLPVNSVYINTITGPSHMYLKWGAAATQWTGVLQNGATSGSLNGLTVTTNPLLTSAAIWLGEQTAPSAGTANQAILYADDNGAGKTRLMVRMPTGAAIQLAIEV